MKQRAVVLVVALGVVLCVAATAEAAIQVQATLTADNHYGLYWGPEGGPLTFVGRNEFGYYGSPGTYNWSMPETYPPFNKPPVIYVVAWDDDLNQGLLGQFVFTDTVTHASTTVVTNQTDWQQYTSETLVYTPDIHGLTELPATNIGDPLGSYTTSIQAEIQLANSTSSWAAPGVSAPNGVAPWGTVAGLEGANWIWSDTFDPDSGSDGHFVIFRAPPFGVPEPATFFIWSLLGGLGVAVGWRRKRKPA
ncbi:MAG: hypothetical protein JW741_13905 [Sedimentisphaerales bacterium]|nr:hypothetical protein [Sedimentisphaerales bacterium]